MGGGGKLTLGILKCNFTPNFQLDLWDGGGEGGKATPMSVWDKVTLLALSFGTVSAGCFTVVSQ